MNLDDDDPTHFALRSALGSVLDSEGVIAVITDTDGWRRWTFVDGLEVDERAHQRPGDAVGDRLHALAAALAAAIRSQRQKLTCVRMLFRWLARTNVLLVNPASELELPRMEKRLPRNVFTAEEAERVIAVPEITDPVGLRDRAILEVLYSTGMRRSEVCKLRVVEVDFERRTVFVREGKGRKDRMIPIGERALGGS
jgi:site-specific recombinase XerD